jgi:hypothetical protein
MMSSGNCSIFNINALRYVCMQATTRLFPRSISDSFLPFIFFVMFHYKSKLRQFLLEKLKKRLKSINFVKRKEHNDDYIIQICSMTFSIKQKNSIVTRYLQRTKNGKIVTNSLDWWFYSHITKDSSSLLLHVNKIDLRA